MLYIHIPFCDSKCFYCAFNSYTTKNYLKKDYFNALKIQFENEKKPNKFKSIFIGGGTPSVMDSNFYEKLFNLISPYIDKNTEITIESNPNSTKKEWLKGLKQLGVNRISFGVQSFDNEKLKFLGRNHSSKSALLSIENAKKVFDNVNLDLIYATILDNKTLLQNDLDIAVNLGISHISAYSLTIEKNTEFYKTPDKRKEDEELEVWFIEEIKKHFTQLIFPNNEMLFFLGGEVVRAIFKPILYSRFKRTYQVVYDCLR
jgi:oxygen-independent coproporphyrinogen-3 oxidase